MTSKSLHNQQNRLVIADSGAIFSLAIIDQLEILNLLFDYIKIPIAVWKEITQDKTILDNKENGRKNVGRITSHGSC